MAGGEVTYQHLNGSEIKLNIIPGTKNEVLKRKGIKISHKSAGDLHIHYEIEHPKKLSMYSQIAALLFFNNSNNHEDNDNVVKVKKKTIALLDDFFKKLKKN